jgi:hypothetical protein
MPLTQHTTLMLLYPFTTEHASTPASTTSTSSYPAAIV